MPINITGMGETLLDSMAEECTLIEPRTVQTPTGGYGQAWSDSVTFNAVIRKDNTLPARVAEKQGVKELYTVVVPKGFPLRYNSVLRCKRSFLGLAFPPSRKTLCLIRYLTLTLARKCPWNRPILPTNYASLNRGKSPR